LSFLKEAVVEGDTWATFAAFSKKWGQAYYRMKGVEKYLPRIQEAGEEDDFYLDEDVIGDTERLADQVSNKVSELLAKENGCALSQALGELSGQVTVTEEKMLEAVNAIKAEFIEELRYYTPFTS
jgi:hypothetical protein